MGTSLTSPCLMIQLSSAFRNRALLLGFREQPLALTIAFDVYEILRDPFRQQFNKKLPIPSPFNLSTLVWYLSLYNTISVNIFNPWAISPVCNLPFSESPLSKYVNIILQIPSALYNETTQWLFWSNEWLYTFIILACQKMDEKSISAWSRCHITRTHVTKT